jgi:hypothetical protein
MRRLGVEVRKPLSLNELGLAGRRAWSDSEKAEPFQFVFRRTPQDEPGRTGRVEETEEVPE